MPKRSGWRLPGEASGLWIWAGAQQAGRGRAGRSWASPAGNLHASLLLRPRVPLATALQLSLLAGVAAHDAVSALAAGAGAAPAIRLKWPNDILLNDAKLGGILLESRAGCGRGCRRRGDRHRPQPVARARRSGAARCEPCGCRHRRWSPRRPSPRLPGRRPNGLLIGRKATGFETIRGAWLERAKPLGGPISVRLGAELVSGTFLGIDEIGALRLATESGERRITAVRRSRSKMTFSPARSRATDLRQNNSIHQNKEVEPRPGSIRTDRACRGSFAQKVGSRACADAKR